MSDQAKGDADMAEVQFNPLRAGKSFLQKLDELVPKANDVLKELCSLRESLGNGAWDWPTLTSRGPASEDLGYD